MGKSCNITVTPSLYARINAERVKGVTEEKRGKLYTYSEIIELWASLADLQKSRGQS